MSVLLLGADYYGTLAAARCLGREGVRVHVADDHFGGRTLFSRYASHRHKHPPLFEDVDRFVEWLSTFGQTHPGTALVATNDHLAWLFGLHREVLARAFRMYQSSAEAILTLLDKGRLAGVCKDLGLSTPKTEVVTAGANVHALGERVGFPLLIKPRTQIFLVSGLKGVIVETPGELDRELTRYRGLANFAPVFAAAHPDALEPMFQEYIPDAETNIFSVSGFITEKGEMACRAAMKVLQRPRKVGIGLCFESRDPEPKLEANLVRLAKAVGYMGPFEAEFIARGEERLLIDYNPRFFSQMAFDDARGMPTARLTYHAARGDEAMVQELLASARAKNGEGARAYQHGGMLRLVLALQERSGQMTHAEAEKWHSWMRSHKETTQDAVWSRDDVLPAVVDTAMWLKHFARHPRSFWRSFVQNR